MTTTPMFEHDCGAPCCIYLGSTNQADVYLTSKEQALTIRKGSDGPDYRHMSIEVYRQFAHRDPEVASALALYDARVAK